MVNKKAISPKMKYNPNIHHRKSTRLKGYDYTQAGLYFITICVKNRECLFGNITNGKMLLNDSGKNANECWLEISNHFSNTQLHEYIIMPNHIHGIIEIVGANQHSPNVDDKHNRTKYISPLRSPSKTIGSVVRGFKIGVTKWFRLNMGDEFPIGQSVWQRNYYDHIIRNEKTYQTISEYIINNPLKWQEDKFKGNFFFS